MNERYSWTVFGARAPPLALILGYCKLLVVNLQEYFNKIMPATTLLAAGGSYMNNVLPYLTDVIQDANVPDGKSIFGLASRYNHRNEFLY